MTREELRREITSFMVEHGLKSLKVDMDIGWDLFQTGTLGEDDFDEYFGPDGEQTVHELEAEHHLEGNLKGDLT